MNKSAEFSSYAPLLSKFISLIKPKRILEWGPGGSTAIMFNMCPGAEIITYEHRIEWFIPAVKKLARPNVYLRYATKEDYYDPGVHGKFDLIFIDGWWRNECLLYALKVISDDGVVILHDCDRPRYESAWKPNYNVLARSNGTLVLKPKGK